MKKQVLVLIAILGLVAAGVYATPASITPIGALTADAPDSRVYAISPDGSYAVGSSNTGATVFAADRAVIWSLSTGLIQLPGATSAGVAKGVVVRTTAGKIGVGANFNGKMQMYEAPLADLANGTWTSNSAPANTPATIGAANISRLSAASTTEGWYTVGKRALTISRAYAAGMSGVSTFEKAGTGATLANSISGSNYMAGYDTTIMAQGAQRRALLFNGTGATTVIPGGNSVKSEAYGISVDGLTLCGYDYVNLLDTDFPVEANAFVWKQGDAGMTLLGRLAGESVALAIAVNNAGVAVGYSGDSISSSADAVQDAVIWDTTGLWDSTGTPKLAHTLLSNAGVNMSDWTRLVQVTTISDDGMTIGGYGKWAADGSTRGFIATIPEPATLLFLGLGGLFLSRRRTA